MANETLGLYTASDIYRCRNYCQEAGTQYCPLINPEDFIGIHVIPLDGILTAACGGHGNVKLTLSSKGTEISAAELIAWGEATRRKRRGRAVVMVNESGLRPIR